MAQRNPTGFKNLSGLLQKVYKSSFVQLSVVEAFKVWNLGFKKFEFNLGAISRYPFQSFAF